MRPLNVDQNSIRLSEVVSALSLALDLTEGQPMGHAIRSCILGMRIAEELELPSQDCSDLYYALLLKDSGCSSNAARMHAILGSDEIQAKREVKLQDMAKVSLAGVVYMFNNIMPEAPWWQRIVRLLEVGAQRKQINAELVGARCERGADIARMIGLSENAALAIRGLDEHWDGSGYPDGAKGAETPILARIINLSQTLEVFAAEDGPETAIKVAIERSGTWFDPDLVKIVKSLRNDQMLWARATADDPRPYVLQMEPGAALPATPERIDSLCRAFAQVIDAKSPYTFNHSVGVAEAAVRIAQGMALSPTTVQMIRRAGLLHDIGKLSVSNAILEKPGKLTDEEWKVMKLHPVYSRVVLKAISGFENISFVAGAHHERLDGSGYPDGLSADQMPLTARIVAAADVYQALSEKRPYRESLPHEVVMGIMGRDANTKIDGACLDVLNKKATTATDEAPRVKAAAV
jgi:HD-GYP domain-containing protein (c-di-GMP phosphodiesterase class II)